MADSDIAGLTQAQSGYVDPTDELIVQKSGETSVKKIQVDDLFGGWRDLFPIGFREGSATNAPSWAAITGNIYGYRFGVGDELWLTYHFDHDVKQSATFYPHVHWLTTGTDNGNVQWRLEYSIAAGHGAGVFPAATTLDLEQAATGVALTHLVNEDATGIATPLPDTLMICKISRIAASVDELVGNAFLLTVDMHYPTQMYATKNRTPNFYTG